MGAAALRRVKAETSALSVKAKKGTRALGCLGFIGGLLTAFLSLLGMLNVLNPLGLLVEAYTFIFGVMLALLEAQNQCFPLSFFEYWARFITTLGGRGFFYLYVGSLIVAKWTLLSLGVGGYMIIVGVLFIAQSYRVSKELKEAEKELNRVEGETKKQTEGFRTKVKQAWEKYDPEGNGAIYTKKLGRLCKELGRPMDKEDLKEAKTKLDPDRLGEIDFEDFLRWWAKLSLAEP
uniref:EF-hand domain-containing protein n=1 Tax=Lotharella oceanica TaxID=641309 RepID=A0A7S2X5S5_9EUKA